MRQAILTESDLQTLERRIMAVDRSPDDRTETDQARRDAEATWFRESFQIVRRLIATIRALREDLEERDRRITHLHTVGTAQAERIRTLEQEMAELKEWRNGLMVPSMLDPPAPRTFEQALGDVINRHSRECAAGDTPDFILADYLAHCLEAFGGAVRRRNAWYSRPSQCEHSPSTNVRR